MLRICPTRLLGCGSTLLREPRNKICGNMSSGSTSDKKLRVLVDMDGVLADFEGGFLRKYRSRYPSEPYITMDERRGFWVSSQYGRLRSDLCVRHKETSFYSLSCILFCFISNFTDTNQRKSNCIIQNIFYQSIFQLNREVFE